MGCCNDLTNCCEFTITVNRDFFAAIQTVIITLYLYYGIVYNAMKNYFRPKNAFVAAFGLDENKNRF